MHTARVVEEPTDIIVVHLHYLHINPCIISMELNNVSADCLRLRMLQSFVVVSVVLATNYRCDSIDVIAPFFIVEDTKLISSATHQNGVFFGPVSVEAASPNRSDVGISRRRQYRFVLPERIHVIVFRIATKSHKERVLAVLPTNMLMQRKWDVLWRCHALHSIDSFTFCCGASGDVGPGLAGDVKCPQLVCYIHSC